MRRTTLCCLVLLGASLANGQTDPICDLATDTLATCEAKVEKAPASIAKDATAKATTTALKDKNTGTGTVVSGRSAVTDFLSKLALTGGNGSLGEDSGNVTIELNDFLGLSTDDGYKLTAQLREPKLSEKLTKALPEAVRATRKEELQKGLDDLDDVVVAFTYSPMSAKWGRAIEPHDKLWDTLFSAVLRQVEPESQAAGVANKKQGQLLREVLQRNPDLAADVESNSLAFAAVAEIDRGLATDLLGATVGNVQALTARGTAIAQRIDAVRMISLADLIDNQPQLNFTASKTVRSELVGPDETAAKITYEHGFVNVRKLRASMAQCLATGDFDQTIVSLQESMSEDEANGLSDCYAAYFTEDTINHLKLGHRLAISVDYKDIEGLQILLPGDDAVMLDLAADSKITGTLAYSRYLKFAPDGTGQSRLNLAWSYEQTEKDNLRNTRSIIELTYAQRIVGDLVLSTGLVYANEPEFRGDVEQEFSAQFGLKYKLDKDKGFGKS